MNLIQWAMLNLTSIELETWQMLERIGFVVKSFKDKELHDLTNCFYAQMPFEIMRLDFALPTARLAIEVNGSYWHGSRVQSLTKKQMTRQLDDSVKQKKLTQHGWKLLTIVDSDLQRDRFEKTLQGRIWDMLDV